MNITADCEFIIVGAGIAGAVCARALADKGKRVSIIEKREHIGGNAYDCLDEYGILIHKYGPHIFHTNIERVYNFFSRFTSFSDYRHEVAADIDGTLVPVPFNLESLKLCFGDRAADLEKKLITDFGAGSKVSLNVLLKSGDADLEDLAKYIYKKIFLCYTQKQWGVKPEEISPEVIARVPILLSYERGYFTDIYQGMPQCGYTAMIRNMLSSPDISVTTGNDALKLIELKNGRIFVAGAEFEGKLIYTGALDELLKYRFGALPYRTLDFEFESFDKESFQEKATVNYTVSERFTRITEFKKLTGQISDKTSIVREYPRAFEAGGADIPYYPINNEKNDALYGKYRDALAEYKTLFLLGRLAEYKYYNMDVTAERALTLADKLLK